MPNIEAETTVSIPCPVDCVVSLWGDCTPCTKSCGVSRRVLPPYYVPPMYGACMPYPHIHHGLRGRRVQTTAK